MKRQDVEKALRIVMETTSRVDASKALPALDALARVADFLDLLDVSEDIDVRISAFLPVPGDKIVVTSGPFMMFKGVVVSAIHLTGEVIAELDVYGQTISPLRLDPGTFKVYHAEDSGVPA
jgi:transcription antitermination factor NusG